MSARQIREPVNNTGDIAAAFDGITYQKGAAVLSTFENWIGEAAFQRGVQAHMAKHARGAATANDLIGALQANSSKGPEFTQAIRTFLDQPGLPIVSVTPQCPNGEGGEASVPLEQSRYLPLGSPGAAEGKLWQVRFVHDLVLDASGQAALHSRLAMLYEPAFTRLGVTPKAGEPSGARLSLTCLSRSQPTRRVSTAALATRAARSLIRSSVASTTVKAYVFEPSPAEFTQTYTRASPLVFVQPSR